MPHCATLITSFVPEDFPAKNQPDKEYSIEEVKAVTNCLELKVALATGSVSYDNIVLTKLIAIER